VTAIATPRRVVANMFAKGTSFVVEKAGQLVLVAIAGRTLGEAGFGRFSFASSLAVLLAFGSDLGLTTWTTRALARSPERSVPVLGTGLRLRLAASGVVVVALGVVALCTRDRATAVAVAALGVAALTRGLCDHARAVFRAHERLGDESKLNIVVGVLGMGGGIAGLLAGAGGVGTLALGIMAGTFAGAVYGFSLLGRNYGPWAGPADGTLARRMLREAAPFWLAGAFTLIYARADVLVLKALSSDAEVGAYRAAGQIVEAAKQLPVLLMTATFPQLARAFQESRASLLRVERALGGLLLASGLLVAGTLAAVAAPLITLMVGPQFARAVPALRTLALALPLQYLNCGVLHFFIARDRGGLNMAFAAAMVLVNGAANALLDGRFAATGAAAATVVTEAALLTCCLYALRVLRREDLAQPRPR
jgi:O-antigen/teichoic acid export membrane protein